MINFIYGIIEFIHILLVIATYGILFSNSTVWRIFLGIVVILLGIYYLYSYIRKDVINRDEMFKDISGGASKYTLNVILITIVILSIIMNYNPKLVSVIQILTILLSVLFFTKIIYQYIWYYSTRMYDNKVKKYRVKQKITQELLAKKVDVNKATIIMLEQGMYFPSLILANKLSKELKTTIGELFMIDNWYV